MAGHYAVVTAAVHDMNGFAELGPITVYNFLANRRANHDT